MKTVKVCVYDEEERFAKQLAAFLNRQGQGTLYATAVTNRDRLLEHIEKQKDDIILASDPELLLNMKRAENAIQMIWLKEEKKMSSFTNEISGAVSVSRYAGARKISQIVEAAAGHVCQMTKQTIPVTAVYSPVGRCGKTQFALDVAGNPERRWIYLGMEDYGIFWEENKDFKEVGDAFLYYIKERKKDEVFQLIHQYQGMIPSAFSPFDTKLLDWNDWKWMTEILREQKGFWGVIVDIGTGILQEVSWLAVFDYIIVPYLKEKQALKKKERFQELMDAYGLAEEKEKIQFVDMGNEEEIRKKQQEMGCG